MFSKLLYNDDREGRYRVVLSRFALKQIRRIPEHIQMALRAWATTIVREGIRSMRRIPGYHDEPLKGDRLGQRSSRLSRGYRVIYEETESGEVTVITVQEVSKHDY